MCRSNKSHLYKVCKLWGDKMKQTTKDNLTIFITLAFSGSFFIFFMLAYEPATKLFNLTESFVFGVLLLHFCYCFMLLRFLWNHDTKKTKISTNLQTTKKGRIIETFSSKYLKEQRI